MAKKEPVYACSACGARFHKWMGRCPECNEWNTLAEAQPVVTSNAARMPARAAALSEISMETAERFLTGISEFDTVCGGGLVPGSIILLGGEPGIGKSTLALQAAATRKSLYISGEESPAQIRQRSNRLAVNEKTITVSASRSVEDIVSLMKSLRPELVIVDSIQTIATEAMGSAAGTVPQIRESAARLSDAARDTGSVCVLIGHITKEGSIAGPKVLEHIVDTVLYFEGDWTREYRMLRSFKNRFGSVNEIGLFIMTETGLRAVEDRNALFLNPARKDAPGNAVSAGIEGSRSVLFEVQSLVLPTSYGNPRRMADGFDQNRLSIIAAVIEKHMGIPLSAHDIFLNVAGGFQISETASDLAVAASLISSHRSVFLPKNTGFIGEIALSGEIRPVSHLDRRINEFLRHGFTRVLVPGSGKHEINAKEILSISSIADLGSGIA